MSLIMAADLLRQYNKDLKKPIDSQSDRAQLGTWSYGNTYDALYDRLSSNKNFNINAWHQSVKLGEQDAYISLIERNQDTQMSDQFYDPSYYNYEAMMLELYKPLAENDPEKATERMHEVWDYRKQQFVEESLGEMTDQQYLQYQIDQAHKIRADEITRQLEQDRKDNMGWFALTANTIGATVSEFGEGVLSALAGIVDFFVAPFAATGMAVGGDNWLDAYVEYYGELGLTALEKDTVRAALDNWERTHTYIKDIDGNMTGIGKYLAGIANSIGMMMPAILINMVAPGVGMFAFYTSIYGNNLYENATDPARKNSPSWLKVTNAVVKSSAEAVVEWGLGKILGGTLQNQLIGLSGKGIIKEFGKHAGLQFVAKSAAQEGLEEFLQDFSTNLIDQFTGMIYEGYEHTGVNFQTLIDSFMIGALSSIFMSGGAVARNAIMSKATSGKSDVFIEKADGTLEKVKGFNRLAWSSMMQDFQSAMQSLQKQKMGVEKNLELAQEVYGGMTVMAQFYQSFSTERIVNSEKLLKRVADAEQRYERSTLTGAEITTIQKADLKTFADILGREFTSMVGEVGARHADRVKKSLETVGDKLKEADVTEIKSVIDKDGTRYAKDPAMTELEQKLLNKHEKLFKDYDFVFTTDGHIAVEVDGMLYVSEAWLENYTDSEIYKFLVQEQILEAVLKDKELSSVLKEVVKHNKSFVGRKTTTIQKKGGTFLEIDGEINEVKTEIDAHIRNARDAGAFTDTHFIISYKGQTIDVTEYAFNDKNKNRSVEDLISKLPKSNSIEQALMDLLFNKTVYQHFLLSNKGKNLFKFKDYIFRLHELIKLLGESKNLSAERKAYLNQVYEQIKQTMREPTIKALVNWNMNPQLIGADSILTEADKQFVNQYQTRKKIIADALTDKKVSASYQRVAKVLLEHGQFTRQQRDLITVGLQDNANDHDRLIAVALLNEADRRYTVHDYTVGITRRNAKEAISYLEQILALEQDVNNTREFNERLTKLINDFIVYAEDVLYRTDGAQRLKELFDFVDNTSSAAEKFNAVKQIATSIRTDIDAVTDSLQKIDISPGIFAMPVQAMSIGDDLSASIQFRADKLNEFRELYGIDAQLLLIGDVGGITNSQMDLIRQEMEVLGVDNYSDFVCRKLENMLGPDYAVTPIYKVSDNEFMNYVKDFEIVKKIPAEQLIIKELLSDNLEKRNVAFVDMFEKARPTDNYLGYRPRKLSDFMKVDLNYSNKNLLDWNVVVTSDDKANSGGFADARSKFIVVNIATSSDFVHTLVHEINHAIQYEYYLTRGFHWKTAEQMTDFMQYILQNYTELIAYILRKQGNSDLIEEFGIFDKRATIDSMAPEIINATAYAAYRLVQGELWAEYYMHNGKLVKAFTMEQTDGKSYIVSPDGKTKFLMPYTDVVSREMAVIDKPVDAIQTENAFTRTFDNIFGVRSEGYINNRNIRKTYHSRFTRDAYDLIQRIINKGLPITTQLVVTINDIILNPEQYLSQEMLNQLRAARGPITEGSTYHFLKEWFENNIDGVSLDRDGVTHEYLFVDDNAFDDLLTFEMSAASQDDNTIAISDYEKNYVKLQKSLTDKEKKRSRLNLEEYTEAWLSGEEDYLPEKHKEIDDAYKSFGKEIFYWAHGGFDVQSENRSNIAKEEVLKSITPEIKEKMLRSAHYLLAPDVDYKTFLEMDIPYVRFHEGDVKPSPFFSAHFGISPLLIKELERVKTGTTRGLIVGTVKPKDITGFLPTDECEAFLDFATIKEGKKITINKPTDVQDLIISKSDDKGINVVQKYTSEDGFNLNRFYSVLQLSRLGLPSNIKVIANNKVKTETIIDRTNPNGLITINVDGLTTNAEFVDKLNHEFRHLLQHYANLEQGFTADFRVSPEMLADIKTNVPEIFRDRDLIDIAKRNNRDPDTYIAQRFVYYMIGGEQNAYGIRSRWLNTKPAFVTTEGGKPVIYMPWYDAKTGDGRYQTEFLAARAEDKGIELPRVKRKRKYISGTIEGIESATPKRTYKYTRKRSFTKAEAAGTNLQYFVRRGIPGDMDPDLKNFIIATTGQEAKLPKPLVYAIQKGKLTKQALYKWFRNAKASDINQFTFDLVNKHMFKNDTIKNMAELERLVNVDVSFWWAACVVLKREGLSDDSFKLPKTVNEFLEFVNTIENSKWKSKIEKMRANFNWYFVEGKSGRQKRVEIGLDQATSDYMRVFAMQYFDGTLAGAFYTARTLRHIVRLFQNRTEISLDAPIGDGDISMRDLITEDGLTGDAKAVGNDIIAMYELEVLGKSTEEMIIDLGQYARDVFQRRAEEQATKLKDISEAQKRRLIDKNVREAVERYIVKLQDMTPEDIALRYQQVHDADMTGLATRVDITNTDKDIGKELRVNIVQRIKYKATRLNTLARDGKVVWKELPKEIKDMFETSIVTVKGKKIELRQLKPEVYSVGKGRVRQDTTRILENDALLKITLSEANKGVYILRETAEAAKRWSEKREKDFLKSIKREKVKTSKSKIKETEFRTNKRKRTVDQPNNFTIVSGIDMPVVLRKIFDVSFDEMANTEVQFISKDESGNLYEKGTKQFAAAEKHEVKNWDVFYEAVREQLLELTRTDILDIVEFIQMGVSTVDGPTGKLAAFQIFILGYIVDGARRNFNNWNFSDAEIQMIEKLYEQKASDAGSALNAVNQMLKVVDPFKKIRQRMLEDYNISDDELKPLLDAVDKLQREKDLKTRKTQAIEVEKEVRRIEQMMIDRDIREKGWGKRWYQKLKSARYSFMLSSPITWIRNIVSNIVNLSFNTSADRIGGLIFSKVIKKNYRQDQWDITNTKVSDEAKTFIDDNITNSELFELLYDGTTKYDDRAKKVTQQKELFVTMIVNSLERKYAAEHRFDNTTANMWARFINKMISDKPFIKKASNYYLAKILTIEAAKGKIDLSKGLSNEVLNLFAEAVVLANTEYMRKRSFFADMLDWMRTTHPNWYEVLNWWQPFLNSSFNWFQETLKYNPLAIIGIIYRSATLEKHITKLDERRAKGELVMDSRAAQHLLVRDMGKSIIGLMLTGLGILLATTGVVKIEDDDDKFFIVVGDLKIDISNIFGSSSVLIGASLAQAGKTDFEDILKDVTEVMLEGFFLKDILDRHKWNNGMYEAMLTESESILRSFVPQFVQLMIRATNNKKLRYTPGFKGVWERWLNSWVPTQPFGDRKINPYTGEVETKYALPFVGELLKSGLLGPKIFWSEVGELEAFAREYGVNKVELTGELTVNCEKHLLDRQELNIKYGELNKKSLAELQRGRYNVQMEDGTFSTLSWSQMSDRQRARVIDRTMTQNAEIAKIFIWTQTLGRKYYASDSLWATLRQLKITKNVYKGGKGFVK